MVDDRQQTRGETENGSWHKDPSSMDVTIVCLNRKQGEGTGISKIAEQPLEKSTVTPDFYLVKQKNDP